MSDAPVRLMKSVPGLAATPGYSYAASSPDELVFFSGQVPIDADGKIVGAGDFDAQMQKAFANLRLALAEAGCSPETVLRTSYFIVGLDAERLATFRRHRDAFFAPSARPASTLLGVAALFHPDCLIEVEVVAARRR